MCLPSGELTSNQRNRMVVLSLSHTAPSSNVCHVPPPPKARAATDEAERARKRGRVTNALETALARAGEQGGSLQLRTRGTPGAWAQGALLHASYITIVFAAL